MKFSKIEKLASPELEEAERIIRKMLSEEGGVLHRLGVDAYSEKRKRARPLTLILTGKSLGYNRGKLSHYGAVVELIHTSTLVHDDIIDKAELRRGKPTLNRKWGDELSLLFGDQLFLRALRLALEIGEKDITSLILKGTLEMIEGEAEEKIRAGDLALSEEEYLKTVRKKTGALFSLSAEIGTVLGGGDDEMRKAASEFGYLFGTAFQIADDILNLTKNDDELTKSAGNDLPQGKITLPVIYLLEEGGKEERKLIENIIKEKTYSSVTREEVIDALSPVALNRAYRKAYELVERANEKLEAVLPRSEEREALYELTFLMIERAKVG